MNRLGYVGKLRVGQSFPGIVLSSETSTVMSPADRELVESYGIAGINCSWNRLKEIPFDMMGKNRNQRILPLLYAANTVNYGKPSKLNTAEAMAASLYITGFKEEAQAILGPFSYGAEFLRLNETALEAYSSCSDSADVIRVQDEFISQANAFMKEKEIKKSQRTSAAPSNRITNNYLDEDDLPPVHSSDEEYEYDNDGDDNVGEDDHINGAPHV